MNKAEWQRMLGNIGMKIAVLLAPALPRSGRTLMSCCQTRNSMLPRNIRMPTPCPMSFDPSVDESVKQCIGNV